ncbi:unnamed protein product [Allacma fusca]|uniref:Uncharacterized protein n=1 Tax=Allacma fusca TaxID=39272 RepID=A0A8J2P6E4_9HEXA|nr:unnamed protein product [Allacma fusca]
MTSPDISFTSSSDSGSDEDFQECPVYKNLRQSKAKLKQVGDPDFLVAECKKLDNKIELLQKNKRKLRKDKIGTLNWSRQLRELESYLEEGNEEELRTLESEHEEVQSTIKDLEEEINELQKQKESIGIQMDRKLNPSAMPFQKIVKRPSKLPRLWNPEKCLSEDGDTVHIVQQTHYGNQIETNEYFVVTVTLYRVDFWGQKTANLIMSEDAFPNLI